MKKYGIGIIGCGNISDIYIKTLTSLFKNTEVVAVTDIIRENALEKQRKYRIPKVCENSDELMSLQEVDIVLILTQPKDHALLMKKGMLAGKHVYCEKPMALNKTEAEEVKQLAAELGLHYGSAPDTILGAVVQTGRKLIDDGWIGNIVGASICASFTPPETWHPNPAFLYKVGAGPLFDNGPYLIATLVYLMGPIVRVMGMSRKTYDIRTITAPNRFGEKIGVEVPTFIKGVFQFESGAIASIMLSTDSRHCRENEIGLEVYGSNGTIVLSHPCTFGGKVEYRANHMDQWDTIPLLGCYNEDSRGVGVADFADAIENNREPKIAEDFVYHVMDCLLSFDEACKTRQMIDIKSTCKRPEAFSMGIVAGQV